MVQIAQYVKDGGAYQKEFSKGSAYVFERNLPWQRLAFNDICFIFAGEYDDEYDCLSVLHSHSQDVKKVCWSPIEDVSSLNSVYGEN